MPWSFCFCVRERAFHRAALRTAYNTEMRSSILRMKNSRVCIHVPTKAKKRVAFEITYYTTASERAFVKHYIPPRSSLYPCTLYKLYVFMGCLLWMDRHNVSWQMNWNTFFFLTLKRTRLEFSTDGNWRSLLIKVFFFSIQSRIILHFAILFFHIFLNYRVPRFLYSSPRLRDSKPTEKYMCVKFKSAINVYV